MCHEKNNCLSSNDSDGRHDKHELRSIATTTAKATGTTAFTAATVAA
ncbi:hypothetical protein SAMN05444266_109269 [Chitinophaga jiangningensis]|uniref:Uncharacterized protein n=1 Tax=Chitinophaga jiangningensis TaxID=1419482 RepID=A0A1M7KDU1_9BACT|nr:hypothetical protein [Chitinophaga jiangningensis]SHM63442.1 hypothetical protein SAMN05444266_109269 [Chitinophaga jiangningensis]